MASQGKVDADTAKYAQALNVHMSGITRRTFLLTVFLMKEANYVTAAVVLGFVCLALLPLSVFLGVLVWVYYVVAVRGSAVKHAWFMGLLLMVFDIVYAQLHVVAVMCVNFSTVYRVYKLVSAVLVLQVNRSIKDMDRKMTSLANTVYGLVLLFVMGTNPDVALVASLTLTLVLLLKQMNEEKVMLQQIARPLKDFNENRLSTFEIALLWTKVLEDFLDDDVQYNWVQAFRVREPLKPVFNGNLSRSQEEDADTTCCHKVQRMKDWVTEKSHQLWDDAHPDMNRDLLYLQDLDAGLAETFGNDGQGVFAGEDATRTIESSDVLSAGAPQGPRIRLVKDGSQRLDAWANALGDNAQDRALAVAAIKKSWGKDVGMSYLSSREQSSGGGGGEGGGGGQGVDVNQVTVDGWR